MIEKHDSSAIIARGQTQQNNKGGETANILLVQIFILCQGQTGSCLDPLPPIRAKHSELQHSAARPLIRRRTFSEWHLQLVATDRASK